MVGEFIRNKNQSLLMAILIRSSATSPVCNNSARKLGFGAFFVGGWVGWGVIMVCIWFGMSSGK